MREIATSRGGAWLSQAPASAVSTSSITVKSAASALSEICTRTVAREGSLVKLTWRSACQERAAIWTDVPAISMQALGPVKNSLRANRATIASGTTEARIFKRNMTRYSLAISPRHGAYGWQRVKETSYRGVDAGCCLFARHPYCEWPGERRLEPQCVMLGLSASLRASEAILHCAVRWIACRSQ